MVKSMFAAIAGLKSHQTKMDVISNNIANVNTWGYKSKSTNFADAMYQNMISGAEGDITTGSTGGKNASQLGFGANVSSITADFTVGSWNPTGNGWNCMINGPAFFIVGPQTGGEVSTGSFSDSGLSMSRVGIFQIDSNGYLTDDQGNYVYGFSLTEGTGTPEIPAQKEVYEIKKAEVKITDNNNGTSDVEIGGVTVEVSSNLSTEEKIAQWCKEAVKDTKFEDFNIAFDNYSESGGTITANITLTAKEAGANKVTAPTKGDFGTGCEFNQLVTGSDRVAAVEAEFNTGMLAPIRLPQTGDLSFNSFTIGQDGTIVGIDSNSRPYTIGKIALAVAENPNGLEQSTGYLYDVGPNAGDISIQEAGSDAVGKILSGYLEMSNVDLATEMANMITTQRGYQANTKMITVTDTMLEELVNMKR